MGNCQAAEAATVVIQHPEGKIQRLYWPTTVEEVMKSNPGHHVALVITQRIGQEKQDSEIGALRFARVRLLKPNHVLMIGQIYRLIAEKEAMKAIKARKHDMLKRRQHQESKELIGGRHQVDLEMNQNAHQQKSAAGAIARARQWQPSLCSIVEDGQSTRFREVCYQNDFDQTSEEFR